MFSTNRSLFILLNLTGFLHSLILLALPWRTAWSPNILALASRLLRSTPLQAILSVMGAWSEGRSLLCNTAKSSIRLSILADTTHVSTSEIHVSRLRKLFPPWKCLSWYLRLLTTSKVLSIQMVDKSSALSLGVSISSGMYGYDKPSALVSSYKFNIYLTLLPNRVFISPTMTKLVFTDLVVSFSWITANKSWE